VSGAGAGVYDGTSGTRLSFLALVLECKKIILSLTRMAKVRLTWVPGHSGVRGNEEADRMSLRGSKERPVGPELIVGLAGAVGSAIVDRIFWQRSDIA